MVTVEEWADEQFALASRYAAGRVAAERRRVKVRWWSVPNNHRRAGAGKVTVLWSMARGNTFDDRDIHVALYEQDAPPGAAALLWFIAQEGSGLVESQGRTLGTALGRAEPGGALVVETSRGAVMPASVPAAPGDDTPGWSDTGAAPPEAAEPQSGAADTEARTGPSRRRWWRRRRR